MFLKDGWIVRSENFTVHQVIGEPNSHAERMRQWNVDELVLLDISSSEKPFEHYRNDYKIKPVKNLLEFIKRFSFECNMPLSFGGNIKSFDGIKERIKFGADKVILNSVFSENPEIIAKAIKVYGKQAIIASIDYKKIGSSYNVFINKGSKNIGYAPEVWAKEVENIGAGEILLQSIDHDGKANGYDLEIINKVSEVVNIPVIACSGAGHSSHILECFNETNVEAVAAGNFFHFTENAYPRTKKYLSIHRKDIRLDI